MSAVALPNMSRILSAKSWLCLDLKENHLISPCTSHKDWLLVRWLYTSRNSLFPFLCVCKIWHLTKMQYPIQENNKITSLYCTVYITVQYVLIYQIIQTLIYTPYYDSVRIILYTFSTFRYCKYKFYCPTIYWYPTLLSDVEFSISVDSVMDINRSLALWSIQT